MKVTIRNKTGDSKDTEILDEDGKNLLDILDIDHILIVPGEPVTARLRVIMPELDLTAEANVAIPDHVERALKYLGYVKK